MKMRPARRRLTNIDAPFKGTASLLVALFLAGCKTLPILSDKKQDENQSDSEPGDAQALRLPDFKLNLGGGGAGDSASSPQTLGSSSNNNLPTFAANRQPALSQDVAPGLDKTSQAQKQMAHLLFPRVEALAVAVAVLVRPPHPL